MQRLISIIGKAPSELPFPDLLSKLAKERDRVRQALERFREGAKAPVKQASKAKARSPSSDGAAIKKLISSGKISKSKILELIQQAKKEQSS